MTATVAIPIQAARDAGMFDAYAAIAIRVTERYILLARRDYHRIQTGEELPVSVPGDDETNSHYGCSACESGKSTRRQASDLTAWNAEMSAND